MKVKEKLSFEKSGENIIRLYKEGIFYIAYNHSALRFRHFINAGVKILRHELKDGSWYLRIGVVQTSPMLHGISLKDDKGNYLDYIEIPCDSYPTVLEEAGGCIVTKRTANTFDKNEQEVIAQVRGLNLGMVTPVRAISLIEQWQNMLR